MSLVLEALEKAQRQGQVKERPLQDIVKTLPPIKPRRRHKLLIFNLVLFLAIVNLFFLRWWLNRKSAKILVDIPVPIYSPSVPQLDVTGIVWDEKEPIVLVNGKFLKKGEEILGAKLIDIQPNEARFLRGNEELSFSVE